MRTQEEIAARMEAADSLFGFAREVLVGYLDYEHVKPYLKEGVTPEEWASCMSGPPLEAMTDYMEFAIGKALDHRGISASRSVEKLNEWSWLLGFDEAITDPYPMYGVPILKALSERHGLPWPEDNEKLERMAQGLPCHPGCEEGC